MRIRKEVEVAGVHCVFDVVNAVGDVVGHVHDLGFDTPGSAVTAVAHEVIDVAVVVIHAELPDRPRRVLGRRSFVPAPRVFDACVQGCAREVEASRPAVFQQDFGFQTA